jgi:hypothetical protein
MITGFLINALGILVSNLIALLPTSSGFTSGFNTSLTQFFGYAYSFNDIFPIDTLITVLGLTVAFQAGVLLFKMFNWVLGKIRGSN